MILEKFSVQNETSINDLPAEVLCYIFQFLSPYRDLNNCKRVCRFWLSLCSQCLQENRTRFLSALSKPNQTVYWNKITNTYCPYPRYLHSSCRLKDSLYIFGGFLNADTCCNDLWRFDLNDRTWSRMSPNGTFPSAKAGASLVSYNNKLYLYGGYAATQSLSSTIRICDEFHEYDLKRNKWKTIISMETPMGLGGHGCALMAARKVMVLFGGVNAHYQISEHIWQWDFAENNWKNIEATSELKPEKRFATQMLAINEDEFLMVGGRQCESRLFYDVWIFNLKTYTWRSVETTGQHPLSLVSGSGVCMLDKNIIATLGRKSRCVKVSLFLLEINENECCAEWRSLDSNIRYSTTNTIESPREILYWTMNAGINELLVFGGQCRSVSSSISVGPHPSNSLWSLTF